MRNISKATVLAVMAAAIIPFAVHGEQSQWHRAHSHDMDHRDDHYSLKVALWGDEFYAADPATKTSMTDQTINSMNSHHLDLDLEALQHLHSFSEAL